LAQNGILAGGCALMDRMIPLARGYRE